MRTSKPLPLCPAIGFAVCVIAAGWSGVAQAQSEVDGFDPGANGAVWTVAQQPDGKIVVGGSFTMLGGGGTGTTPHAHIGRLNVDGSDDSLFNPGTDGPVYALALQSDGKILVAGSFANLDGVARSNVGRLNADGTIDLSFNPGANSIIYSMAVQPDGRILIGGQFSGIGGGTGATPRAGIGRLEANGLVDNSFNPGTDGTVFALAVQPDERILAGGSFTMLHGIARNRIGRVNADGSLDATFNPGADDIVRVVAVQADAKILIGGRFTTLGGVSHIGLGRLNADGSPEMAFNANLNASGIVYTMNIQADGQIVVGGNFTMMAGAARNYLGRLTETGSLDGSFNPGADGTVLSSAIQGDGKILAGGSFSNLIGVPRNGLGRLEADGSLDATFNPGANSVSRAITVQSDGRILLGGDFSKLGGGASGMITRNSIGRLNPDGSVDANFDPGTNGNVFTFAEQPDGKIVVGGLFSTLAGGARSSLGRLDPGGSLDASFNPGAGGGGVQVLALQPDGKILVGGQFIMLGGGGPGQNVRNGLGRLNANGALDASFNPRAIDDPTDTGIYALAVQPDGKILIGGYFPTLGGSPRSNIARVNQDGTLDASFNPGAGGPFGTYVDALALQSDGKILVGGYFTTLAGASRSSIGRLNPDGSLDTDFNPGANGGVYGLTLQADGRIVVHGLFSALSDVATGNNARRNVGRFNPDGSLDGGFDPSPNGEVFALALQRDGKVLMSGNLNRFGQETVPTRWYIARVTNNSGAVQSLMVSNGGGTISWLRSGTGPDVSRVTFELSTDAIAYTALGTAARIGGGWQLVGQSLPVNQNVFVRARGYYTTEGVGSSAALAESVRSVYVACPILPPVTLPGGNVGDAYSAAFSAQGVIGMLTFGETGALPAGITFSAGVLSGMPTQAGSFPISVMATDSSSGCSGSQNFTLTVTAVFTDDPLVAGVTAIKAAHIRELRGRIDALRARYGGRPSYAYTDATIAEGTTVILARQITEMRTALSQAYSDAGRVPPSYSTNPTRGAPVTVADIVELRAAVRTIE